LASTIESKKIKKLTYDWPDFAYNTKNEDVKVFFSKEHPSSAVNSKDSFFHGMILWDVFLYAMAIGKFSNNRVEFSASANIPIEWAKEKHLWSMIAVVMSEPDVDLSIFDEPRKIATICEEYANGGVERLIEFERLRDPDNPISEYEKELYKYLKIEN